jgi:hypothetical protein
MIQLPKRLCIKCQKLAERGIICNTCIRKLNGEVKEKEKISRGNNWNDQSN